MKGIPQGMPFFVRIPDYRRQKNPDFYVFRQPRAMCIVADNRIEQIYMRVDRFFPGRSTVWLARTGDGSIMKEGPLTRIGFGYIG